MSEIWSQQIASGANDAEENGPGYTTGNQADFGVNPCLFRFVSSPIPPGSTIVTCKITFTARATNSNTLSVSISADDVDNSAAPTDVAGTVSGRTLTTASVSWSMPAFTDDLTYDTPELKTVLQEVVDRGGWSAGNAVSFITHTPTGGGARGASMADFVPSEAAELYVEYDPPASSSSIDVDIIDDHDDAEESTVDGSMDLDSYNLGANNAVIVGWRFQAVAIPQGAIVTGAHIAVYADGNSTTGATMTLKAIDEDDCAAFTSSMGDLSGRAVVGNTAWSPGVWTGGQQYLTADISALVQQVVSRPGWESGNALGILLFPGSGPQKGITSYDKDSTKAALLHVVFEEGSSVTLVDVGESWATVTAQIAANAVLSDVGESWAIVAAEAADPTTNVALVDVGESWATIRVLPHFLAVLSDVSESWAIVAAAYDWPATLADISESFAVIAAEVVTVANAVLYDAGESWATVTVEVLVGANVALHDVGESWAVIAVSTTSGLVPVDNLSGAPAMAAYVWQLDSHYKEIFGP